MKFHYYPDTDSLYIHLSDKTSIESAEVAPNIIFDYDENGAVVSIDIDHASRLVNMERLEIDFSQIRTAIAA